jgi:hypothetical protein
MPARRQRPARYGVYKRLGSPQLIVRVEQHAIDHSIPRSSSHCMIAETIRRLLPDATGVAVDLSTIRWTDPRKALRYVYLTPREAQVALIDYDRGNSIQPFAFKLHRAVQVTRGNSVRARAWRERKKAEAATAGTVPEMAVEDRSTAKPSRRRNDYFASMGAPRIQEEGPGAQPTVIGGRPLPPGNLARVRRFGARVLIE